jgi:hypothetical protein
MPVPRRVQPYGQPGVPIVPAEILDRRRWEQVGPELGAALGIDPALPVAALGAAWAEHRPADAAPPAARADLLQRVVDRFGGDVELCGGVQPFAALQPHAPPPSRWPLSTRPANALSRTGRTTVEQLAATTVDDLRGIRSFGLKSLFELWCVGEAAAAGAPRASDGADDTGTGGAAEQEREDPPRWLAALGHLAAYASAELGARHLGELIAVPPLPDDPVLRAAAEDLLRTPLTRVADEHVVPRYDVAAAWSAVEARWDDRTRHVLHQRLVADPPATLDQVGAGYGLTRERIRQVEKAARTRVAGACADGPLHRLCEALADGLGTAFTDGPAADAVIAPLLDRIGPTDRALARSLLLVVAGYTRRGRWWDRDGATPDDVRPAIRALADEAGLITEAQVGALLDDLGVRPPWRVALLAEATALHRVDGGWLRWDGTIVEKLIRLLAHRGRPATPEELLAESGEPHSPQTVRNGIFEDPRVVRVDRDGRLALRDWGVEGYAGLVEAMCREVESAGGAVRLGELATALAERYAVREQSVHAYATAPMFVIEDGLLRLRRPDEPWQPNLDVRRQRGICATARSVAVVRVVGRELLRGSGTPISLGVAARLGLQVDESRTYRGPDGLPVTVALSGRAFNASISSLRAIAAHVGATTGDALVLRFDIERPAVAVAVLGDGAPASSWAQALFGPQTDLVDGLAEALGVEADAAAVRAALEQRGDHGLASLVDRAAPAEPRREDRAAPAEHGLSPRREPPGPPRPPTADGS